jgi:hypothetical protein
MIFPPIHCFMYVCWVTRTAVVPINLMVTVVWFTRSTVPLIPATSFELIAYFFYLLTHLANIALSNREAKLVVL